MQKMPRLHKEKTQLRTRCQTQLESCARHGVYGPHVVAAEYISRPTLRCIIAYLS